MPNGSLVPDAATAPEPSTTRQSSGAVASLGTTAILRPSVSKPTWLSRTGGTDGSCASCAYALALTFRARTLAAIIAFRRMGSSSR